MNNAEIFSQTFGIYATEMWAMPESEFLSWLNSLHDVNATNITDTISRQDALRFTNPEDWGTPDERWMPESEYGRYIQSLPSAERTGQWIEDKYGNILCSECNWSAPKVMVGCLADRHLDYEKSDYCWHCGARMVSEE